MNKALVTLKTVWSQLPEMDAVLVTYETHRGLINTIQDMIDELVVKINTDGFLSADHWFLRSFNLKKISSPHDDIIHYEVIIIVHCD